MIFFWRVSIGFIASSLTALLLARVGYFSGYAVFFAGALSAVILPARVVPKAIELPPQAMAWSVILAVIAGAYAFAFATTEYYAGRDHGVYTLIAHNIAKHHRVNVDAPVLREAESLLGVRSGFPGIHKNPFGYQAQFNHISPAVRAGFVQVFGRPGMAMSSALFASVAVFAFSALAMSMVGTWWGIIATVLLGSNAAFVYVARSSLSEVYTLAFFAIALSFCRTSIRHTDNRWAALIAGLSIGCIMLSRADGYLIFPILFLTVFAILATNPSSTRSALYLTLSAMLLFVWSVLDLRAFSNDYFTDLFDWGMYIAIWATILLFGATFAFIVLNKLSPRLIETASRCSMNFAIPLSNLLVLIGFLLCLALFARSFCADQLARDSLEAFTIRAPRELTWYTTIPLAILAFWGAHILIKRDHLLGVAVAIPCTILIVFFVASTVISPDHPWAARRWVPFTIPVIILFGTVALATLPTWPHFNIALSSGAMLLALYAYQQDRIAHNWWFLPIQAGWDQGFDAIAAQLRARDEPFFLASWSPVASLLTYVYGIPTAPIPGKILQLPADEIEGLSSVCGKALTYVVGTRDKRLGEYGLPRNAGRPISSSWPDLVGSPNPIETWCADSKIYAVRHSREGIDTTVRLVSGWSHIERWGVWSEGVAAEARIWLSKPIESYPCDLIIEGRAFVAPGAPDQKVDIYVDGEHVRTVYFEMSSSNQQISIEIPQGLVENKHEISVRFEPRSPRSPLSLGLSEDNRLLGFGLSKIRVVRRGLSVTEGGFEPSRGR